MVKRRIEDLLGQNIWQLFPEAVGSQFHQVSHRVMSEGKMETFEEYAPLVQAWFQGSVCAFPDGISVCLQDITDRIRSEETLRQLSKRIVGAQEVERRRVARELHDSVSQILSSVKFRIQSVGEMLPSHGTESQELQKANHLLEQALREVRRISQNLRPSQLDDLGLKAALRGVCQEFRHRTQIVTTLKSSNLPEELPSEVELALYRIIQEALNNVEKHSAATRVTLKLFRDGPWAGASIKDNGRGFELSAEQERKNDHPAWGLVYMRERAAFVGGTLCVESGPGRGTEITVRIPLHAMDESERLKDQPNM
jgi:two-component system NarL family sensor kinase